jgi:hypothetical protein
MFEFIPLIKISQRYMCLNIGSRQSVVYLIGNKWRTAVASDTERYGLWLQSVRFSQPFTDGDKLLNY